MKEYYGHKCLCGCGQFIEIKVSHKCDGIPKYISGHNTRVNQPSKNPEVAKKISESKKGTHHTKETRDKISEAKKGKYCDSEHSGWKGGNNSYWHVKARELFDMGCCEECGISNEESLQLYNECLSMHCTSIPKNYKDMSPDNWKTLCKSCHRKEEYRNAINKSNRT